MEVQVHTLQERLDSTPLGSSALSTEEYFVNMGPQHPSTHGVLRLVCRLDGETVREVIPVLGYVHRGIEKVAEHLSYKQCVHLSDRMDYLSAFTNNWAVAMAVEKAAGIAVNERIEAIRTIFAELQRIQSHQLWWGVFGMDLGAFTPFLYGFRDREIITDIFEETVGGRLTMNYILPGGVMFDLAPNFQKRVKEFLAYFKPKLEEYERLFSDNVIVKERLCGVGVLKREDAISLGATGPVLRASGVSYDLRKNEPYGLYGKLDFDVPVGTTGDCWDRYNIRLEEMRQSMRMIEQLVDNIPEGKTMLLKPAVRTKLPEGRFYTQVETARGILGLMIVSEGKDTPYRMHFRSPCFNNLWVVTSIAPGWRLADLVTILSTLDVVVPDIDK
jgi:NADH-quinone oxidoreductase subunit D